MHNACIYINTTDLHLSENYNVFIYLLIFNNKIKKILLHIYAILTLHRGKKKGGGVRGR